MQEYIVENYHDIKEFIQFIREYKPDVNEAEYRGKKLNLVSQRAAMLKNSKCMLRIQKAMWLK